MLRSYMQSYQGWMLKTPSPRWPAPEEAEIMAASRLFEVHHGF